MFQIPRIYFLNGNRVNEEMAMYRCPAQKIELIRVIDQEKLISNMLVIMDIHEMNSIKKISSQNQRQLTPITMNFLDIGLQYICKTNSTILLCKNIAKSKLFLRLTGWTHMVQKM